MAFIIRKGLAYRKIDGLVFIVDAAGERLHELNAAGSIVWEGLAAGKSEARIAEAVCAEFDVAGKTAREDTAAFIKELSAAGLINPSPAEGR
ncbi:MAG: PqqD family protein [Elusimicrobia bacterium]|nr:PqqD family protein [Elusimicrobiota bacterium]